MSTNHTSLLPVLYSFRRMEELAKPQLCWSMCGIGKGSQSYGLWRVLASIFRLTPSPTWPESYDRANHNRLDIAISCSRTGNNFLPDTTWPPLVPQSLPSQDVAALKPVSWLSPVAGAVSRSSGCTCGFTLMLASCELAFAQAYGPLQPIQRERPEHLSLSPRPVTLSHS